MLRRILNRIKRSRSRKRILIAGAWKNAIAKFLIRSQYLKIETTNICNANCVFCSYRFMQRKKSIMPMDLFKKAINDYIDIGGGALTIAPIVGDCLIDFHFLDRLRYCSSFKEIVFIGTHTNLIALDKWSDEQLCEVLSLLDVLNCSIGPNRKIYMDMFGVDCFEKIVTNLERLANIMGHLENKPLILLNGRTARGFFKEDVRIKKLANILMGCKVKWLSKYFNWGGFVNGLPYRTFVYKSVKKGRQLPCIIPLMQSVIFSDGQVGLCGCADFNAFLNIGNIHRDKLGFILSGEKRRNYIFSFLEGMLNDYCLQCSVYRPMDVEEIDRWREWTNPFHAI